MATSHGTIRSRLELALRAAIPCAILAAGWFGFSKLTDQVVEEPPPPAEERILRTRVEPLDVIDYPVVVATRGVVQAHNDVSLAAEVAGVVTRVSPSFETGAYFARGDVLIEIDARNYAAAVAMAKSRLLASKSALQLAELVEQRKLRLIKSNAVPQAEVDSASATREQAEADVALAKTQVEQAELDLQRTTIVAPFSGRVRVKSVGLGQMVTPNAPVGEIFAVDFAEVRLPISGRQRQFLNLPEFADDEPVVVELRDALSDSSPTVWHGQIIRTEGVLDQDSRELFAIARIDDPFGRDSGRPPLRIGQPVAASIEGVTLHDVIALPRGAVRQLNKIVLVDRESRTLQPLEVKSVWSDAEHVVVAASAIPPGNWIATTPLVVAPAGAEVEIIPAATPAGPIAETASADGASSAAQ